MTKYIARHDGKIVGKRTTKSRTYTHALVVQSDEAMHRRAAYEYEVTKTDRSNFDYYCEIVREGAAHRHFKYDPADQVAAAITQTTAMIDGGFDAYVIRLRDEAIAKFEDRKARGGFAPHVATWCGRLDLAHKAISQFTGDGWTRFIAIVETEIV